MLNVKRQEDYKRFAENLRELTGCEVEVKIMGQNHFHFGLISKEGIPIIIICWDKEVLSFAPFRKLSDDVANVEYINMCIAPNIDDFCNVLQVLKKIVM